VPGRLEAGDVAAVVVFVIGVVMFIAVVVDMMRTHR
jgi:hypothetical protein